MKKLRPFIALTLVLALTTSSIQAQQTYYQQDESYSSAYSQGSNAAHWSVYVPIAILVGAAIWFGLADRSHKHHDSSDSQDGLGSIANSKRHSSHSYNSNKYSQSESSSKSFSRSSFSH